MPPLDPKEFAEHVQAAARLVSQMPPNHARTFAAVAGELSKINGISKAVALSVARQTVPGSARAFDMAESAGNAPRLFTRQDFEARRLRAAQTGRIN